MMRQGKQGSLVWVGGLERPRIDWGDSAGNPLFGSKVTMGSLFLNDRQVWAMPFSLPEWISGHQEMAQQLEKLLAEETRAGKDTGAADFADAACSFLQTEAGFP